VAKLSSFVQKAPQKNKLNKWGHMTLFFGRPIFPDLTLRAHTAFTSSLNRSLPKASPLLIAVLIFFSWPLLTRHLNKYRSIT